MFADILCDIFVTFYQQTIDANELWAVCDSCVCPGETAEVWVKVETASVYKERRAGLSAPNDVHDEFKNKKTTNYLNEINNDLNWLTFY